MGGRRTAKEQRQAYQQQVADNLAQWNRQNQYDSPSAQMARFADAGLNPDLIYGQQSNTSPMQIAPEQAGVPNYGSIINSAMGNLSQSLQAEEMKDAQIQLLQSQATKNYSDIENDKVALEQKWHDLERLDDELAEDLRRNKTLDKLDEARRLQVLDSINTQVKVREQMEQQIRESVVRVDLMDVQKRLEGKKIEWYAKEARARIKEMYSRADLNESESLKAQKEAEDIVTTRLFRIDKMMEEANLAHASAEEKKALKDKLEVECKMLINDLSKHQWESYLYQLHLKDDGSWNGLPSQSLLIGKFLLSGILGISLPI